MPNILSWIQNHPELSSITLVISVLALLSALLLAPTLAALIPEDYFSHPNRRTLNSGSTLWRIVRRVLKNLFGLLLLILGILMLLTPGQGLLTIFVALMALDYPGKYRLERWLFAKPSIRNGLNWLRRKAGAKPLDSESIADEEAAS